jgi:ABC-type Fe3+ transport system permease subunit
MLSRSKAGVLAGAITLATVLGCGESPEEVLARKVLEAERRLSEAQGGLYVAFAVAFAAVVAAMLIAYLALSERRRRQTLSKLVQWLRRRKPR